MTDLTQPTARTRGATRPTARTAPSSRMSAADRGAAGRRAARGADAQEGPSAGRRTAAARRARAGQGPAGDKPHGPAKGFSLPQVDASGILAVALKFKVFIIAVVAVLVVAGTLYAPARSCYAAWRDNQYYEAELELLNQQVDGYKDDISRLQTEDGIKDEARKRGYVDEGETTIVVTGNDAEPEEESAPEPERPWYVQLGDTVFGYTHE